MNPLTILLLLHLMALGSSFAAANPHCHPSDKKALRGIESHLGLVPEPSDDCCAWRYVGCDPKSGRVTSLELFISNVSVPIPDSVGDLPFLTSLNFHKLGFTGPIPLAIGRLSRLQYLRLDQSSLTGPIPEFLASLRSLDYLNLASNQLSGSIPASLAKLPPTYIRLDHNRLTGRIPPELVLTSSPSLYLSHNLHTGPIPASFLRAKFEVIDLSHCCAAGESTCENDSAAMPRILVKSVELRKPKHTQTRARHVLLWFTLNLGCVHGPHLDDHRLDPGLRP